MIDGHDRQYHFIVHRLPHLEMSHKKAISMRMARDERRARRARKQDLWSKYEKCGFVDLLKEYPEAVLEPWGMRTRNGIVHRYPQLLNQRVCPEFILEVLHAGLKVRNVSFFDLLFHSRHEFISLCDTVASSKTLRSVGLSTCELGLRELEILSEYVASGRWRHVCALDLSRNHDMIRYREDEEMSFSFMYDRFLTCLGQLVRCTSLRKLDMRLYLTDMPTDIKYRCLEAFVDARVPDIRGPYLFQPQLYQTGGKQLHVQTLHSIVSRIFIENETIECFSIGVNHTILNQIGAIGVCLRHNLTLEHLSDGWSRENILSQWPVKRRLLARTREALESTGDTIFPRVLMNLVASFLPSFEHRGASVA